MAVQFRRDEIEPAPVTAPAPHDRGSDNDFVRGVFIAVRSSLLWLIPAAALLVYALASLKKELIAADELLFRGQGDHWQESLMPAFLFAFAGAVFGALVAWRIGARTSLGNLLICLATVAWSILLALIGAIYALILFDAGVPTMAWLCLGAMMAAALAGAWGLTRWTG